jgi:hypothetical protein
LIRVRVRVRVIITLTAPRVITLNNPNCTNPRLCVPQPKKSDVLPLHPLKRLYENKMLSGLLPHLILLANVKAAEIPPVIPNLVCKETSDCLSFSKRLPLSPSKQITSGYSCIDSKCVYILSPGSECQQPSQCSYYSFLGDLLLKNRTELLPDGVGFGDIPLLMENVCTPSACSVSSSCNSNFKVFFA